MKVFRWKGLAVFCAIALALGFTLSSPQVVSGQETTGGMQGTVKDPSGAVVPGASVTVTTPTLVGSKVVDTDASGYYRLANLPPGNYTILVKAQGFDTLKRENVNLEVGHLPTINLTLSVGAVNTVVEVKTEGPMIDETTTTTLTNIPQETLQDIPHGTSFQSVIQFAPAARNEPLEGSNMLSNGSGSSSPGNGSNGGAFGFSIGGGADSENSYLVEGQETANIIGGYSHTNVPMDFIQEVQMKTSGVEAEYGGALGGVVNVIMDKGTNHWHGSVFTNFEDGAMNGSPNPTLRYDPSSSGTTTSWGAIDPTSQVYQPIRPKTSDFFPGITIGGPLMGLFPKVVADRMYNRLEDRIFLFAGFNPEFNAYEQSLNYGPNGGEVPFSQNTHTYYATARLDAEVTNKIRVFGSWPTRGRSRPASRSRRLILCRATDNTATGCSGRGSSPTRSGTPLHLRPMRTRWATRRRDLTLNTGADITLTNSLVATLAVRLLLLRTTTHFGYPQTGAPSISGCQRWRAQHRHNWGAVASCTGAEHGLSQRGAGRKLYPLQRQQGDSIRPGCGMVPRRPGWARTTGVRLTMLHRSFESTSSRAQRAAGASLSGRDKSSIRPGAVGEANCAAVEAATGYANWKRERDGTVVT